MCSDVLQIRSAASAVLFLQRSNAAPRSSSLVLPQQRSSAASAVLLQQRSSAVYGYFNPNRSYTCRTVCALISRHAHTYSVHTMLSSAHTYSVHTMLTK